MERSEQLKQSEEIKNKNFNDDGKQVQTISEKKAYKVKDSISITLIIVACVMLTIGLIMLILLHNVSVMPIGVLGLYIGYWQKDREAIILFERYIQIKVAPASGTKRIKYEDITKVEVVSMRKVLLHVTIDGESVNNIPLPVTLLSDDDRKDLLNKLNGIIS